MQPNNLTRHVWDMERIKQFVSFSNLSYGKNNRPTDIDGLFELRDRLFIIFEAKMYGTDLPTGQRLALERLTDALSQAKPTLLIVANHDEPADQPIDLASCQVAKIRYKGQWLTPPEGYLSVKTLVDKFVDFVGRMTGKPVITKQ
jgi:hypothetical protein